MCHHQPIDPFTNVVAPKTEKPTNMENEKRTPTKLAQYKSECRFLKGEIRRANATIRMRDKARALNAKLGRLQDNIARGFDPDTSND